MRGGQRFSRWPLLVAVVGLSAALVPPVIASAAGIGKGSIGPRSGATGSGKAASSITRAGTSIRATPLKSPPKLTPGQRRQVEKGMANSGRPGPAGKVYGGPFPAASGPGVTVRATGQQSPRNPSKLFRNTSLPSGGLRSAVNEPSTDANGKFIFATGNWYAARSNNNGGATSWTYIDPFTLFGSGFCCDQVTVYDAGRGRQFWLLQFGDHLVLANSNGTDLLGWCYYNWYPSDFGFSAGVSFDYNHMALSTNFVYVTTNVYGASGGSLVFRTPIDPQVTCGGFSYSWVYRTTEFSNAFVQGAGDIMYWGSNWTDLTLGTGFRVLRWADNTGTYFWYDRTIDAFPFMFINSGQNCASSNGVVLNWCQRTDSRMSGGGYLAIPSLAESNTGGSPETDAILGFAFNATQDGGHPYPYIRRVYFRLSDVAYLGYSELWCTNCAQLYPDMAPYARGHIGIVWTFSGGSSNTYPGSGYTVDDDLAPFQPWDYNFYQFGSGNACLNSDGYRRWGDYLTVSMEPAPDPVAGDGVRLDGRCRKL